MSVGAQGGRAEFAVARYSIVLNLDAAKARGLTIPPSLFARTDGMIE